VRYDSVSQKQMSVSTVPDFCIPRRSLSRLYEQVASVGQVESIPGVSELFRAQWTARQSSDAFFIFFVCLTAFGMEIQKPNKGGGAVTIFKRGQVPKHVEKAMELKAQPGDVEAGLEEPADVSKEVAGDNTDTQVQGVAKNETIFTWQNLTYTIPYEKAERKLLQDVQGYVKPGKLTALMGASGAGKTTLLNTLAQRINFGVVHGDFLVDGRPLPSSFQRSAGFAEQMDVHEPTTTVREALQFSAKLRQPKEVPIKEKYDYVETPDLEVSGPALFPRTYDPPCPKSKVCKGYPSCLNA